MATRIRTLNFLPEIFQTPSNAQFLAATLDQLVAQPAVKQIEGYVGSKFGYGINATDYYVTEPTKTRTDYQLDPGVVFTKENESVAQDFISYPGILDALKLEGALTNDNNRLFTSEIYSWDSFTNLDKIINFNQYYWLPEGPDQVVVSSETVYRTNDYLVTDLSNSYLITADGVTGGSTNPTITLLRGGTYTFLVNQDSSFWIQGTPGVTGYSPTQPNLDTRAVYGVSNNGASHGLVSFSVPRKNAQDEYNFPGNNFAGVVSTLPFSSINGARLSTIGSIDGITALEGLTVMFYSTGIASEIGFVSNFYDATTFDVNNQLVADQTVAVTSTNSTGNLITCSSTENLRVDNTITFTGPSFGGIATYSESLPNTIYYITSIITSTEFTVSNTLGGTDISLTTANGSMVGSINQGLYEEGIYTTVNQTFYTITYVGDSEDPVLRLVPAGSIPTNQKITAQYGTQWGSRNFFKNIYGSIILIPYISAPLDTLYYQDGSNPNKVGIIKLIESNTSNTINVEEDILGKPTFTSSTGIVFTNGLKISFQGDIIPTSYKSGQYYVEGVGTAIELVLVSDLVSPEPFTSSTYIPWDSTAWDISNWEGNSYIPITPDYITIARNAICKNAWSRSNRWFHTDVITQTAKYNNDPASVSKYATAENKAKRPIIEFYPNLRLFNSGSESKAPVDFIDFRTLDAFSEVAGKQNYYPDVTVYTEPTSTISSTNYVTARTATATAAATNTITCDSTAGFRINDLVVFNSVVLDPVFGGIVAETNYYVSEIVDAYTFKISADKSGVVFPLSNGPIVSGRQMRFYWTPRSVEITVNKNDINGVFLLGQYITDTTNLLPTNAIISALSTTPTTIVLEASWNESAGSFFDGTTISSIIATDTTNDNYALFEGARVIFAADTTSSVKNKIYIARFSSIHDSITPILTLTEATNGEIVADQQTVVLRGYKYHGQSYYFDGIDWNNSQFKSQVNQPPQFDVFDQNGKSFGDSAYYLGTSFTGNPLFSYGMGAGLDDIILGFPLRYSSVDNIGDISFDVSLNIDTFNYVFGSEPVTQRVNTGYVYNYKSRSTYQRELGWQTAVSPSIQYQIFDFKYDALNPPAAYRCDIAAVSDTYSNWPSVQVYVNNVIQSSADYTISVDTNSTTVSLLVDSLVDTVVQILVLSTQVSASAYYDIPVNLGNNPFNADITTANIGDIRGQYQSIFYNNPNTSGEVFGTNNYRDLGNLVPYGNKIIQNSASLVLPGTFLRKQNHNLFNSLVYNNREYIKFKTLLTDTVNNSDYVQRYDSAYMLDDALDIITSSKTEDQPFFWSDMLPSKAAYITNSYSFANSLDVSIYPLSRVYDFSKANYFGVLVYLTRTVNSLTTVTQLVLNQDYTISADTPSLTVTLDLLPKDKITIKEYTQTYGSYIPNTPTKMGLFPAFIPKVVLDSDYTQPTYFIRGHDGSYTKLYGDYNPTTNLLVDFRDQVLLEYEMRVYNNLKLSAIVPIQAYEILPGYFRNTGYSYDEFLEIYGTSFLDWVGQNRINYKRQLYNKSDQFTLNYYQSSNKIDKSVNAIGYWRGIYQYYYDTTTPNLTPWEMIGFTEQPVWWESRYGVAPYTSDNLVLWDDLAKGINWNNGTPVVIPKAIRPELLRVLPVDSAGNLLSPIDSVIGNYNSNIFQRDWKVGDIAPAELSYRRSSSWPFDLMRVLALTKPAEFLNLSVDLDNYKYNAEFNQYLVNNRSHLVISDIELYGSGTAKTSYLNWIVDYEKQIGVDATANITTLLDNLDVRLVYRLAGFSDKNMLKFYVEKGTPNSKNASLLIPDESYSVLLYDNQPFTKIVYSGVIIQNVNNGFAVYGNSQTAAYFKTLVPKRNGNDDRITIEELTVKVASDYTAAEEIVPYGTIFYTVAEVGQFLTSYGAYLQYTGMVFDQIENGIEITWKQMVAEFLYWAQTGWEEGSVITLNPAAGLLVINKDGCIVQPLTMRETNFVLNQNLYPIQSTDLSIVRDETSFSAQTLNTGDSISYGQFNVHSIEHGIVFDNITLFNDIIYNLVSGLRQTRITVRGTKTADWNGSVTAAGFILNQDNILEWSKATKYTKGTIVKYKNKYWTALKIIQASEIFDERLWKRTEYDQIQKGLLPNSSTRSYESSLYYDSNKANIEQDADLLSFSLIGYRPRDYLALADLTDITQINVYKNLIKSKGTLDAANAFKGANLPQGGIDYEVYENWAIKTGEFGGVLNSNFAEFKLSETAMHGNPSIVGLTKGIYTEGVQQEIPLYSLFNYGRPITNPDILPPLSVTEPSALFPTAGYVNFNDVKMSAFYFSQLLNAVDRNGIVVPVTEFYVRDYVWLANYLGTWQTYTPVAMGRITSVSNNLNDTVTLTFENPHGLVQYQPLAVINFSTAVDGYYTVTAVVDINRITVTLALDSNVRTVLGQGTGLRFQSQRVETPADIINLPLLGAEFVKNTVWVDTNDDGNWAVYRKAINYQYEREIVESNSYTFGSAVATTSNLGYLVGDAGLGIVNRYTYNELSKTYQLTQKITNASSFGSTIAYAGDLFIISEPASNLPKVYIYKLMNTLVSDDLVEYQLPIEAPASSVNWGKSVAISGDSNWLYISDCGNTSTPNRVYLYRKSQITGEFVYVSYITASGLASGDNFGYSISTDYYGKTVIVSAPNQDFSVNVDNWGYTYVFDRAIQNIESQFNSKINELQQFKLEWTPSSIATGVTSTDAITDVITCASTVGFNVNDPIIFSGILYATSEVSSKVIYFVESILSSTEFKIKQSRDSITSVNLGSSSGTTMVANVQSTPIFVEVNGTLVADDSYAIVSDFLYYVGALTAGDIITISGQQFTLMQKLTTENTPRVGVHFGTSVDSNMYASEIIIGAPFELNSENQEGAVYRYTNGGAKYGVVVGTSPVKVTATRKILINGFIVYIPIGNITNTVSAINSARVSNIIASANGDKLVLSLIDTSLAAPNKKLIVSSVDTAALTDLGIVLYTQTQTITCPHVTGPTQFGTIVKFNDAGSFVVSAPSGTRYEGTTFDFTDDENLDNDTVFDNNSTQWVDASLNAGAVYMFDYLDIYNESLSDIGNFVYAQSINARNQTYGSQPYYGQALDFNDQHVLIGTPKFRPGFENGQVVVYNNPTGLKNWSVFRKSSTIVDVSKIQNIQLFSAETNNTLINFDYIDPLQGKLLGAVSQNIDVVSNIDPAKYNNTTAQAGLTWGAAQVGQLWFDTSTTRFVNYHQNDVTYNSQYWATVFPGSDVAVYSWIASSVLPSIYAGPGTPYDIASYSIRYELNASEALIPVYYYWVRNTNLVFVNQGKTLADSTIQSYIATPKNSGISYVAPFLPNVFGLYNSAAYINANDSVMHIGFSTGTNDDVAHNQFNLIRSNYADDFLPGIPSNSGYPVPESLYNRMLDSLCGVDTSGAVVPNPFLPRAVQYGILARPRQSFFINRFGALKNYLQYANEVLSQYPITEIKQYSFLFSIGEINPSNSTVFFDTGDGQYWEYIDWWATGYNTNTKSAVQVPIYADLATLSVSSGTVVTVETNGNGKSETYISTAAGSWTRIGLAGGTIKFKSSLWDYASARIGFGDNFFDTAPYDQYPSEETRRIVRGLNEQIYTDELLIHRNKSLILLFEYIQSETFENQNYLPWLNKTSFIDVAHTIRELKPISVFQSDNQEFLAGYLNEVKPYHVIIKEFLFKYSGTEMYDSNITDFDLPAVYNSSIEQFISPELVYSNPSRVNQFLPTDPIWQEEKYSAWFDSHGLSLTGQSAVQITTLASYIVLNSSECAVDNVSGFPINGVVLIGTELIAYAAVDRALNVLGGLTRGINGTAITNHLPGELMYIDLPAVLLLDGGRGYSEPPKVIAHIDTSIYPAPTRAAVLVANLSIDSVLSVDVIDPGQGYAVLPEIRIDAALSIVFASTDVTTYNNTIQLYAPLLQSGDLVLYKSGTGTPVGGLKTNQWYYVNVLETVPTVTVALYNNAKNALLDQDRIQLYTAGTGTDHTLNVGAKASCITSAMPVRENNITLRFDRTSYNSRVIDWSPSKFYGSIYAGSYSNSDKVASSSILLQNTQPPISAILASAQGVAWEIVNTRNEQTFVFSSLIRRVGSTVDVNDAIRLIPLDDGSMNSNASGSTIGFYIGMPVKFKGAVIGGLLNDTIYYVHSVLNETDFTISATPAGAIITLTNGIVTPAGLECFSGEVQNQAVLTVNYPGLISVTRTQSVTNALTIPVTILGTGGTLGFYTNLPIFFTGDVFGGVIENQKYYITTVIDTQTFTMSTKPNPIIIDIVETVASDNSVITSDSTQELSVNDPVIFTGMIIGNSTVTNFGNISAGTVYYISSIISDSSFRISSTINGDVLQLINTSGTAIMADQIDTVKLSNAYGDMTTNVALPVSPGQVNGQEFTLFETSDQIPNLIGTTSDLIIRDIGSTLGTLNRVALTDLSGGITNMYVNMPLTVAENIGGLTTGTTYYVTDIGTVSVNIESTSPSITVATVTASITGSVLSVTSLSSGKMIIGSVVTGVGVQNDTIILSQVGPYTGDIGNYIVSVSQSISSEPMLVITSALTCDSTVSLYPNMPMIFTGTSLGGIDLDIEYYVKHIINSTQFVITNTPNGIVSSLEVDNGSMTGTGSPFITVSDSIAGSDVTLTTQLGVVKMMQAPTSIPEFGVSYIFGGYRAIITLPGSGYALDNTITISGSLLGGTTPRNNLIITVSNVTDFGEIISVICDGEVPAETSNKYYLKIVAANEFEVYTNALMTIPANGMDFQYSGATSTTVSATTSVTNVITVDSIEGFQINDEVTFTGAVTGGLILSNAYYILSVTPLKVGTVPGVPSSVVPLNTTSQEFTMAKSGSYILLPEPFYFDQSIVKYNNQVYLCVISNNDSEFIFGKWELLDPSDRRLNALDRIVGYYQPGINMPGLNLSQLVGGIIYPNSTYLGNAFAPADQLEIDTILKDQAFYPTEVDITAIAWDGSKYISAANAPEYSCVISSPTSEAWSLTKLANTLLNVTDVIYAGGLYVITTNNAATPIIRSTDGVTWTTNGQYTPYDSTTFDTYPYDLTALSVASISLNSVGYLNGRYVAAGQNIVYSNESYMWNESYTFTNGLVNQFYSVAGIATAAFTGFVVVGKGQEYEYSTGISLAKDRELICVSGNGLQWSLLESISSKGLYGITSSNDRLIAVGEDGFICTSTNGVAWQGVNETVIVSINSASNVINIATSAGFAVGSPVQFSESFNTISINTTYYIIELLSATQIRISDTLGGTPKTMNSTSLTTTVYMDLYPSSGTLNDVLYAESQFMAVGQSGVIRTSPDGLTWTTRVSPTVENLRGLTYNTDTNSWIVVGDNNTIIVSSDGGITWNSSSVLTLEPSTYTVRGEEFTAGYGPEELVPGVISDSLTMIVATRPGTNWPATDYGHVGYRVTSKEISPTSIDQTTYSFAGVSQTPSQLAVSIINGISGVSYSIYQPAYSVDWVNSTVTLASPLIFSPISDSIRIDVYEPGNGNQLVKANTKTDPIRYNTTTGWSEIYVDCNYSENSFNGSGIIRMDSSPKDALIISTNGSTNTLLCTDATDFVINEPITFQGATFGGVQEDTVYYVKTVSTISNTITISDVFNLTSGIAGATFELSTAVGQMHAIIQTGYGLTWSTPLVYHNGTKLINGHIGTVTRTNGTTNTVTCNTTGSLLIGTPIVFSDTMFGDIIQPHFVYHILTILDGNEFTLEDPENTGNVLELTDAAGGAKFLADDYAFGITENGISAKIIFAKNYDASVDYLAYTLFGESTPDQYSYTIPETELFTGDGITDVFSLSNFVGAVNNVTAGIVEVNGLRQSSTDYVLDSVLDTVTFVTPPAANDVIAVTTFNALDRQYLNTQYGITGNTVSNIIEVQNSISPYIATTNIIATTAGTNTVTCVSTDGFITGQTIQFVGIGFGGLNDPEGSVLYISTIVSSTEFTVEDENGNTIVLSTALGLLVARIGGLQAIRVTTGVAHNLQQNTLIRIDGVVGSVQLNNQIFYARIINSTQIDLYEKPYNSAYAATNYPITFASSYVSGGYAWANDTYTVITTTASATSSSNNGITVLSTALLYPNTPVIFTETGLTIGDTTLGGLIVGTTYYVKEISTVNRFTISAERDGSTIMLPDSTGTMNVTQWEQDNPDRLWVTVNGRRVQSSSIKLNPANYISILTTVLATDEVIITSMIPSATPSEEIYLLNVNQKNEASVYRANTQTRTWLVKPLLKTDSIIYLDDITRITDTVEQSTVAPIAIDNILRIGLNADKNIISSIVVYNNTKGATINDIYYSIKVENLSPVLVMKAGSWVSAGDSLTITIIEGNLIYVNGEQIKFSIADSVNNTLSGLQRGSNGTGVKFSIPLYSEVFGILSSNRMSDIQYNQTWNSTVHNPILGDPLQISTTKAAIFLNRDIP